MRSGAPAARQTGDAEWALTSAKLHTPASVRTAADVVRNEAIGRRVVAPSAAPDLPSAIRIADHERTSTVTEHQPARTSRLSCRGLRSRTPAGCRATSTEAGGARHGRSLAGTEGPLEYSSWFTETGEFGSHDQAGQQVDNGDYTLVDADTLSFPSHSSEFGFGGDILVDFAVNEGITNVRSHHPGTLRRSISGCHAWALSAFASGPWAAGDVP